MRLSKIVIALSSLLVSFTGTAATPLPTASPEKVGFASEGLARIDAFFAREIAADRMPGAAIAIARDGKLVHYRAYGFLNKATGEPMPLEAMFNLASMTKVMTAVGGLTLNEEGRLPLKSRLSEYLPAFAKMNVGVVGTNGEIKLEPASPIYIHDLYRHTSGLTDGGRGDSAVHKLYPSGAAPAAAQYSGEEFLATLAATPARRVTTPGMAPTAPRSGWTRKSDWWSSTAPSRPVKSANIIASKSARWCMARCWICRRS